MKRPHKYHAKRTKYNGAWYDSKAEANWAAQLDLLRKATDKGSRVIRVKRQVSFDLPGGIKYVCDFLAHFADGSKVYYEVKGFETPVWKLKMKLMKATYPDVEIVLVRA